MRSYDYSRRQGMEAIGWERFAEMSASLCEAIAAFKPDVILGIARAGLFPATAVSLALRRELYPVRVTRRVDDIVQFKSPVWRLDVPAIVGGRRVAVVDEIADTGETLAVVAARASDRGADRVLTAALVAHTWADPQPDIRALASDALIIFPWDQRIFVDGEWKQHPEMEDALKFQLSDPGTARSKDKVE